MAVISLGIDASEKNSVLFTSICHVQKDKFIWYTTWKINMSPEKGLSQKGNESSSHLPNIDFQGWFVSFQGSHWFSGFFFSPMNLEVPTYEASKVGIHGMLFRCSHWIHRPSTLPNEGREIHWFAPWTFYGPNLSEANSCHICIFVWQVLLFILVGLFVGLIMAHMYIYILANFQSNVSLVSMMSKNAGTFGMKMWLVQGAGAVNVRRVRGMCEGCGVRVRGAYEGCGVRVRDAYEGCGVRV